MFSQKVKGKNPSQFKPQGGETIGSSAATPPSCLDPYAWYARPPTFALRL